MKNEQDYPDCPRETCYRKMLPIKRIEHEESGTTEIKFQCPKHNNTQNPFAKLMLGTDHPMFKENIQEIDISDLFIEE
jgi:hypothetical protein